MDRIYYFRLVKEDIKNRESIKSAENIRNAVFLPIFRKEAGSYEIYYLQVNVRTENSELSAVLSHMKKGIGRLERWYQKEEERTAAYLVYEASFAAWLKERQQGAHWQQFWDLPLYNEYKEAHNLQLLLQQVSKARLPKQLVILGEAPSMQEWIGSLAKYMREIIIFSLIKPRNFENLRNKLLDEYGLMCKWERKLQPRSAESALVLDYCGKENVFIWGIPEGSIWIDMTSLETRRHALEDRETGIKYISLKSFWREEMSQTLDTACKILYNTGVKLEGKLGTAKMPNQIR